MKSWSSGSSPENVFPSVLGFTYYLGIRRFVLTLSVYLTKLKLMDFE